ncbi:hypothetical protein GMMP13_940011 [Candidatus Magnetomoraceae bacterium gMMP-13]
MGLIYADLKLTNAGDVEIARQGFIKSLFTENKIERIFT